jgi:hypothetical protein
LQYWFRLTLGRYPKQSAGQLVWLGSDIESVCDGVDHLAVEAVEPRYYNDTANTARQSAMDRQAANGLGEYHSEADTRIPTWLIVGDQVAVACLCGLDAAALAVHGFDLTFAAPAPILRTRRQLGVH